LVRGAAARLAPVSWLAALGFLLLGAGLAYVATILLRVPGNPPLGCPMRGDGKILCRLIEKPETSENKERAR
jgi:hypothetical protein